MRKLFAVFLVALVAAPVVADAHGPTRKKVVETINISAPPEAVWNVVKDFGNMQRWHPAVVDSVANGGNEPGATRTLTLAGGQELEERLEKFSDEKMNFSYRIAEDNVEALPVTNYSSRLSVKPDGNGGSVVEWKGGFYRGDPDNNPEPGLDNEAAVKAVTEVYVSGLQNLKKVVENGE